jgi:hypothetical protein
MMVAGGYAVVLVVVWGAVSFLVACQKTCVIEQVLRPMFLRFPG